VTYYTDTNFSFRLTQGAHATMNWGSHNSNTQLRIYSWPDNGGISFGNFNHGAYNVPPIPCTTKPGVPPGCGYVATSPDGANFAGYDGDRIQGAWVANGVIGFMWDAA